MAARDNDIGPCRCPVCGHKGAHLRISVKQLAYVVCNACNCQIMARSDRSDEALRRLHVADVPDPVRTAVAPVGDVQTNVTPAAVAAPAPPARPKPAWGFGRGLT